MMFADTDELRRAWQSGLVDMNARITVRLKERLFDEAPARCSSASNGYDTVVGRAFLSEILPVGLDFPHINRVMKKKEISKLINASFRKCGMKETVMFADKLMYTGFSMAARGGISICMQDMLMPPSKARHPHCRRK
jgi:DNA-directed RNA polymerase subunit beta'